MTNPRSPPRALLRAMGEEPAPMEDAARVEARRAQVVGAMKVAIQRAATLRATERARRQRRLTFLSGFAAAAALVVGAGIAWRARVPALETRINESAPFARVHTVSGSVRATHEGVPATGPASADLELHGGDEITTEPGGRSDVTLADGVGLSLEGSSHLRLPAAPANGDAPVHEEVGFDTGVLRVRVPKLSPGRTFSVRTPDAEVTVHGTAFTVEVTGASTRVAVSEGLVSVTSGGRESLVTAGMQWPVAVASAVPNPGPAPSGAPPPRNRALPKETVAKDHPAEASASSLAEQNRLLASAMDTSRAGDDGRAIALLSELLTRYPSSPLAQEAYVQRFRALERSGDHRGAARQARQYLATYPSGFAREEAKKLALEH